MVDTSGAVHWQRTYAGTGFPRSRLSEDGTLWLARLTAGGGRALEAVLPDGSIGQTIPLPSEIGEEVADFAVLTDGFCVIWAGAARMLLAAGQQPSCTPRVARYSAEGRCLWSTAIHLGPVSHPGVLEMSAETDWEARPMEPWVPRQVEADHREPLLVSGDRIAASVTDERACIGRTFFLDLVSGTLIAATDPTPSGRKAIAGPGEFLIGTQGYGEFSMGLFGRDGRQTARWQSHGAMTVDESGDIRGVELSYCSPSTTRFRQLTTRGTLLDGPPVESCYTSHPALDTNGTAVFWRSGKLLAVDADMALHELAAIDDIQNVIGRTLLLNGGCVALSLGSEILVFRTDLAALADGPWPCGNANLMGNPVLTFGPGGPVRDLPVRD
ncbi:hypothetical protein [Streptomyces sp. NPDC091371]|uniref:hypothetical protein n=1 Tax=Streptomyces sp. NPDC091371 TaxID=3155303 RepID=UPI0034250E0B